MCGEKMAHKADLWWLEKGHCTEVFWDDSKQFKVAH